MRLQRRAHAAVHGVPAAERVPQSGDDRRVAWALGRGVRGRQPADRAQRDSVHQGAAGEARVLAAEAGPVVQPAGRSLRGCAAGRADPRYLEQLHPLHRVRRESVLRRSFTTDEADLWRQYVGALHCLYSIFLFSGHCLLYSRTGLFWVAADKSRADG